MSLPMVSILIPLYNHSKYITKLLGSIFEDSYENKEVIIINDGSTDNSDDIVKEWMSINKNLMITYKYRENKGLRETFNELINMSNGKYIINIASDDYLINNTISKRVELLENNPNKLMLISDAIVVDDKNIKTHDSGNFGFHNGNKDNYFSDKGLKNEILKNWSVVGPVYMVNKKIYDVIGYYDPEIFLEDWDYAVRSVSQNVILFHDELVAAYRIHGKNTIGNEALSIKFIESCIATIEKHSSKFSLLDRIYLWNKKRRYTRKLNKKLKKLNNE